MSWPSKLTCAGPAICPAHMHGSGLSQKRLGVRTSQGVGLSSRQWRRDCCAKSQLTSSVWGCSRASVDDFMGDLAVRWPGVTHRVTLDAHQTAEHLLYTTIALAKQPSTDQVSPMAQDLSRPWLCAHVMPCCTHQRSAARLHQQGFLCQGPRCNRHACTLPCAGTLLIALLLHAAATLPQGLWWPEHK